MSTERRQFNKEAAVFFNTNAVCAVYLSPSATRTNSWGKVVGSPAQPNELEVKVIPDMNPEAEEVTAFGNTLPHKGSKAVFKVLSDSFGGIVPVGGGRFEFNGKTYDVLSIRPFWRGSHLLRYDVLVGYE